MSNQFCFLFLWGTHFFASSVDQHYDAEDDRSSHAPPVKRPRVTSGTGVTLRHRLWLQRGQFGKLAGSWRPTGLKRVSSKRWCDFIDNQLRTSTVHPGLLFFKLDVSLPIWSDWRTWPSLGVAMDLAGDGNSGMHSLLYRFGLNVIQFPDMSHLIKCVWEAALKGIDAYNFVLLLLISFNSVQMAKKHGTLRSTPQ